MSKRGMLGGRRMTRSRCLHLFVYGTLRRDSAHAMAGVLAREATPVGPGTVPGRLYDLGDYPGLGPAARPGEVVRGEVYRLREPGADRVLAVLDRYEGIGPGERAPHEYRREVREVSLDGGTRIPAWAYVLNRSSEGLHRIPTGDYAGWLRSAVGPGGSSSVREGEESIPLPTSSARRRRSPSPPRRGSGRP